MTSESDVSTSHHTSTEHAHSAPAAHHTSPPKRTMPLPLIAAGVLILLIAGAWYFSSAAAPVPAPVTGTDTPSPTLAPSVEDRTSTETLTFTQRVERNESLKRTLTKAKYTREIYSIDRRGYDLFESAANFTDSSLDEIKEFYLNCCDLTSEEDIFADLPPIPSDFAAVAYDIATGSLLQLGQITKGYYLQPEFYFHVGETAGANRRIAFRAWSQPELQYWGTMATSPIPTPNGDRS
ncbi:MAG: hypothetical protein IPJ89_01125 [Candidatus Iainarchaeum archaeon]|uniref:Uncharacterized protein n=1 Tax=Candidatus Iainarchaeum sp. TaxID=3101447 RepID=A0A7T9DK64_9ARCH|nr:MAG: hypothetical protein IPJ89_01125 [Candidatus Diapherotrites archaeon]